MGKGQYLSGDQIARQPADGLMTILGTLGVQEQRVKIELIGAGEGNRFAEVVKGFTAEIRKLGPNS